MSTAIRRCDYACLVCGHGIYLLGREFPDTHQGWCSRCRAERVFVREVTVR